MRNLRYYTAIVALFASLSVIQAQVCTLDIGGKNQETIIAIFQLNASQKVVMDDLRADLSEARKINAEEIKSLFDTHPQSTEAELMTLSEKYNALKENLVSLSRESDEKLLATFNPKQYERYLGLCMEAFREPIKITPVNYNETTKQE